MVMVEAAVLVRKLRRLQPGASCVEDVMVAAAFFSGAKRFGIFMGRITAALKRRNVPTSWGVPIETLIPLSAEL